MAFFEVGSDKLHAVTRVSLAQVDVKERGDLQRLLRTHLPQLVPDVLVISEEFGEWDDSRRRIDLLAIDRQANLVVIELKRGDSGQHMELQAIRYAAMVSTMTFEQAVVTYEEHLTKLGAPESREARARMLQFLNWSEPNEDDFAQDVRIILFSEDFSLELTSSILWLNNKKQLDITCFRMRAYQLEGRVLLDFQQIIPLKEAEEYQVKVRNKQLETQSARRERVPWNGELYANYGDNQYRSWEDAQRYGFISAGGGDWFTRTLRLLTPGSRVWVNRPGSGYIGVGIVSGEPVDAADFMVDTAEGRKRYIDLDGVHPQMRLQARLPDKTDRFVPIDWLVTVPEARAIREPGLFGNQNSAAQPTSPAWPSTVQRLKQAFGLNDDAG